MKKLFCFVCAVVLMMTSLICMAAAEETVTLRVSWWGGDTRHEATLNAIAAFEEKYPNIKIEAEPNSPDGYRNKYSPQMAAGTAPDIMQIDAPWLYELQTTFNCFEDLTPYFGEKLDVSGFDQALIADHCMVDGKVLGLPCGINADYMLLNTSLLEPAGVDPYQDWTWDSILTDGAKVHQVDPEAYFLNVDSDSMYYHVVRRYMMQLTGNQLVNEDYTLGFTVEDMANCFSYVKALFDNGVMQPAEESFYGGGYDVSPIWLNNKVAANLEWTSTMPSRKVGFADTAAAVVAAQMVGQKDTGILIRPSITFTVSSACEHKEEAILFMNFFFNDPAAIAALKMERSVPPTVAGRQQLAEAGELDPMCESVVNASMEVAGMALNTPSQNSQFERIWMNAIEEVAYGAGTPEEVAAETYVVLQQKGEELKESF